MRVHDAHDVRPPRLRPRRPARRRERIHAQGRPAEQLVDAIRIIARGDALLAPSVTQALIDEIARQPGGDPAAYPGLETLTERELDVIRLMAKGRSNAEIANELYLGEATIKTHVGRILAKLAARDRVQAVVIAYESGLVTPGDS